MKHLRTLQFLALILLISVGACGQNPPPSATPFGNVPEDRSIRIDVTNLNFGDATLWALTQGGRKKLGVVTGKRNAVYTLPWRGFADLQIQIDILAEARCTTRVIRVDPGDVIELIIDLEMTRSPLCGGSSTP